MKRLLILILCKYREKKLSYEIINEFFLYKLKIFLFSPFFVCPIMSSAISILQQSFFSMLSLKSFCQVHFFSLYQKKKSGGERGSPSESGAKKKRVKIYKGRGEKIKRRFQWWVMDTVDWATFFLADRWFKLGERERRIDNLKNS